MLAYSVLFFIACVSAINTQKISVFLDNEKWTIKYGIDESAVAYGSYSLTRENRGFNELSIHTNNAFTDKQQMYATGFIDGYFSGMDIDLHTRNMNDWYLTRYLDNSEDYPSSVYNYLKDNIEFINTQIEENPDDDYWNAVSLVMEQIRGIVAGYNFVVEPQYEKTFFDLFMYNSFGDLLDLAEILPKDEVSQNVPWFVKYSDDPLEWHLQWKTRTKCSGLVKYIKDDHDIYISQDAWFMYGGMTRTMKHFDLQLNADFIKAKKVSFSSYPGFVFSFDDFYMTSTNLAIIETTFSNFNTSLYEYVKPTTLLDWIRITISVRMATTGQEFKDIFEKYNSGTYNNQWVIVNYNIFNSVEDGIPEGSLTVVEQLPGHVYIEDYSSQLETDSYFGSFNVPAIEETIEMGNVTANAQGNNAYWNSPTECCRAKIFDAYAPSVTDMDKMKKMMKYNDYTNEPLSIDPTTNLHDPGASIGARYDLRPTELHPAAFGQLDSKICSKDSFSDMRFHIQAGPTHDDCPVLDLNEVTLFSPMRGVVRVWDFDWEEFIPN
ncbi:Phospholipase B-like [Entamoeba marina]